MGGTWLMMSARISIPPPGLGADDNAPCFIDADGVGAAGMRCCSDGTRGTCWGCEGLESCRARTDDAALPLPESSQGATDGVRFDVE